MNGESLSDIGTPTEVSTIIADEGAADGAKSSVSFARRLRRVGWHLLVRQITLWSLIAIRVAGWIGRKRRPIGPDGCEIMLTGRFDSANWILAHLGPLSASKECKRLWMVSTNPVPELPRVVAIYPPKWLMKLVGATPARLLTFAWQALRKHPDFVGGFHLVLNGITTAILGPLAGARSMYFCVGGPAEIQDGGVHSQDNPFSKMETPDSVVQKRLLRIISKFDAVIAMGTRAVTYFRGQGIDTHFHVVSGGIDSHRFGVEEALRSIDLILTGRLVPIKRIDILLEAVRCMTERLPDVRAAIVGDGKLRTELEHTATALGIQHNVTFAGHQEDVQDWLRRAKIFVLTSDSEGLSLSMMEAMMCGLPAVVSDVGDLGDLVETGVNGYLVPRRSPQLLAERLVELLSDAEKLAAFSQAARRSAMRYEKQATIARWDDILAGFDHSGNAPGHV
jgi:glycosyltransferase involved in cell wall biosynthesis